MSSTTANDHSLRKSASYAENNIKSRIPSIATNETMKIAKGKEAMEMSRSRLVRLIFEPFTCWIASFLLATPTYKSMNKNTREKGSNGTGQRAEGSLQSIPPNKSQPYIPMMMSERMSALFLMKRNSMVSWLWYVVPPPGLEPGTLGLRGPCSTNWAIGGCHWCCILKIVRTYFVIFTPKCSLHFAPQVCVRGGEAVLANS